LSNRKQDPEPICHRTSGHGEKRPWQNINKWDIKVKDIEDMTQTMTKKKRKIKNIWDPQRAVLLTGNTGWQESQSNPGSLYREIYVTILNDRGQVQEIGPQYVDASMKNYERKGWDKITELLDEGYQVHGTGCIVQSDRGDLYLDSDSFDFQDCDR